MLKLIESVIDPFNEEYRIVRYTDVETGETVVYTVRPYKEEDYLS